MVKKTLKRIAKGLGLRGEHLKIPYYYLPYLFLRGKALKPIRVDLEVTFRCNMRCRMCPQAYFFEGESGERGKEEELTLFELRSFFADLSGMGVRRLLLTGGEPMIRGDVEDVISSIKKEGFHLTIGSNGSFITSERARFLVKSRVDSLVFSLDGPEEIHNRVRGVPFAFNRLEEGVQSLLGAREGRKVPSLTFFCAISSLNQGHLAEVVRTAKRWGADGLGFGYLFYTDSASLQKTQKELPSRGIKPEDQNLPEELRGVDAEALSQEVERVLEEGRAQGIGVEFSPPLRGAEVGKRFFEEDYTYVNKCFYPWYNSRVDPYGNIYPCSLGIKMGNIRERPFSKVWNSAGYREFRKRLKKKRLFPSCTKCCELNKRFWSLLPSFCLR